MQALLNSVPQTLQQAIADSPLPETPGHSQVSPDQSHVGSLHLFPGSWCLQGFVFALQVSVSPVLCKFWWLYGDVKSDLIQEGLCHTQVCCTQREPLPLWPATADLYLCQGHSNTVLAQSMCGLWVLVCTRFVWALRVSLVGLGFNSKCDFAPPFALLGLSLID